MVLEGSDKWCSANGGASDQKTLQCVIWSTRTNCIFYLICRTSCIAHNYAFFLWTSEGEAIMLLPMCKNGFLDSVNWFKIIVNYQLLCESIFFSPFLCFQPSRCIQRTQVSMWRIPFALQPLVSKLVAKWKYITTQTFPTDEVWHIYGVNICSTSLIQKCKIEV